MSLFSNPFGPVLDGIKYVYDGAVGFGKGVVAKVFPKNRPMEEQWGINFDGENQQASGSASGGGFASGGGGSTKSKKGFSDSLPFESKAGNLVTAMLVGGLMMTSPVLGAIVAAFLFGPALFNGAKSLFSGGGDSSGTQTQDGPASPRKHSEGLAATLDKYAGKVAEKVAQTYHDVTEAVGIPPSTNRNVLRWVKPLGLHEKEKQYNLPTGFLSAIMDQESRGIPGQRSSAACEGLFQFKSATAAELCIDPNKPEQASDGAARMYASLAKKYNNNLDDMMAAYNWGQGNLDNFKKNGYWTDKTGGRHTQMPEETRKYIARVKELLPDYEKATIAITGGQEVPTRTAAAPARDAAAKPPAETAFEAPHPSAKDIAEAQQRLAGVTGGGTVTTGTAPLAPAPAAAAVVQR